MFEIEKNVPVPEETVRMEWPFKDMEVGDSVLFTDESIAAIAQVRCHVYGSSRNKKFKTKKQKDGIRIWRIQ